MKEIGGYIEFEHFNGEMLHEDGIKLDCGRSCLAYLIEARQIERILMPSFMCDAVFNLCDRYNVSIRFYNVGYDLKPHDIHPSKDEYLYLSNYYGQLTETDIKQYKSLFEKVIVDNTQAYFSKPIEGVDTLYTCRKYFGVADGGILFTDASISKEIGQSESFDKMTYLLGRFERSASEYYEQSSLNNDRFENQPLLRMSMLTENLLHGIDYKFICQRREDNYNYLHNVFKGINRLSLIKPDGPFSYPLMIKEGAMEIRKRLAKEKIYIPVLWPNVLQGLNEIDYDLAMNILPLPCDQRYSLNEMKYLADRVNSLL